MIIGGTRDIAGNTITIAEAQRWDKQRNWQRWYERQTPERQAEVGRRAREAGGKRR